ncbi:hypothetical protein PIB30_004544 [Stylosanthes scabra]|uniref:Uncharacterized protein n=1 Tax=Stylosanthes scabra TaxID=79078 RepID=A0ABU6Y5G7_9FABA|nr:hypothetical protein [Stylosanthes scabra]
MIVTDSIDPLEELAPLELQANDYVFPTSNFVLVIVEISTSSSNTQIEALNIHENLPQEALRRFTRSKQPLAYLADIIASVPSLASPTYLSPNTIEIPYLKNAGKIISELSFKLLS